LPAREQRLEPERSMQCTNIAPRKRNPPRSVSAVDRRDGFVEHVETDLELHAIDAQWRRKADARLTAAQQQQTAAEGLADDPVAELGVRFARTAVAYDVDGEHQPFSARLADAAVFLVDGLQLAHGDLLEL